MQPSGDTQGWSAQSPPQLSTHVPGGGGDGASGGLGIAQIPKEGTSSMHRSAHKLCMVSLTAHPLATMYCEPQYASPALFTHGSKREGASGGASGGSSNPPKTRISIGAIAR